MEVQETEEPRRIGATRDPARSRPTGKRKYGGKKLEGRRRKGPRWTEKIVTSDSRNSFQGLTASRKKRVKGKKTQKRKPSIKKFQGRHEVAFRWEKDADRDNTTVDGLSTMEEKTFGKKIENGLGGRKTLSTITLEGR